MKHMCSWSGGTDKCNRCDYKFCNYHGPVNNGGASGGHQCVCREGSKNAAWGANCDGCGSFSVCQYCKQKVCSYHQPINRQGVKGGHSGCSGPECATSTVFKHMCAGTSNKCNRCNFVFCNYHRDINNGGAQGGHVCVCTEGKKGQSYGVNCSGSGSLLPCPHCKQKVCPYHAPPNQGGTQGGHSNCSGPKCSVDWGACRGFVTEKCKCCELDYCQAHLPFGGRLQGGGHACDIGCQTTIYTKGNCTGTKHTVKKCPLCAKAGNDYEYCPYHFMPVTTLLDFEADAGGGGHVCQGFTGGSMLIGDSLESYLGLAADLVTTAASFGTVNPLAATIAANACTVVCYEVLDALGLTELFPLAKKIQATVQAMKAFKAAKKENDAKAKGEQENLTKDFLEVLAKASKALRALPTLANPINGLKEKIGKGVEHWETAINWLDKFLALLIAAQGLQQLLPLLGKCAKARPPMPGDILSIIGKCTSLATQIKIVIA